MAKILLAASPEPQAICRRILKDHELLCAETISQAEHILENEEIHLILCTIVFDDSRMFDLLRLAKSNRKWKRIPFVCCKVRAKLLDSIALEGVQIACKTLGAAAFLNFETYEMLDPVDSENEILKDIERLLPGKDKEKARGR